MSGVWHVLVAILAVAGELLARRLAAAAGYVVYRGRLFPAMAGGAPAAEFAGASLDRGFSFDVTIDPANHTAVTSVDTVVTVPSGILLDAADKLVAIPPAALNAGISVQTCRYTSATTFTLRTTNASAGAIDPASGTWTIVVLRN